MKKVVIITWLFIVSFSIFANEKREFRFIEELYQRDNLTFAQQEIERFREKYPDSEYLSKADYYEAMIHFFQNNFSLADEKLQLLEKKSDQEIKPLVILALIQTKFFLNDFVVAEKYIEKFISSYPSHNEKGEVYYWKGRIALERGNLNLAEESLLQANNNMQSSMINYLAFQIKLKQNKIKEAKVVLDSTYSNYHDEFVNQIVLEWFDYLYQKLDYNTIVRDSKYQVPNYSRLHSDYAIILGQAYYKLRQYDNALNILRSIQPTTDIKQFHIALTYKAKGDINLAKTIFTELASNSQVIKIKELSFFEMVNSSIAAPQGTDEQKDEIRNSNLNYLNQLTTFISDNPNSNYLGNAYYLQGFIYYLNENYQPALDFFLQANNSSLDNDTREKLLFLIGDIYFLTNQLDKSISFFEYYQDLYPQGRFYNEVLYKLGLNYFDKADFEAANSVFLILAKNYSSYKHISTVYFYLGEINTIKNNYSVALEWFELAQPASHDQISVWMRIAETNYLLSQWQESFSALNNIPEGPLYDFRVNLIKGNIYYNLQEYDKAISHYQISSRHASKSEDVALITSRIGWTYYLKGDFALAERAFRSLSNFSTTSEDYLILAGNSALNGKRFNDAISLFQEFLNSHPVSTKTNYVRLNLADAYYNLKQYKNSFDTYALILGNNPDNKELRNSLLGIKWSVLNHHTRDYRPDLRNLANEIDNSVIKQTLSQIVLLYENETEKWDDAIKTAESLLKNYPQDQQNKVINQTLALAYSKKKNYQKADSLYSQLTDWHKDAEIYMTWSDAFISRHDTLNAIKVLDDAIQESNELSVWFKLLDLKVAITDQSFTASYQKFINTAEGNAKNYAQLLFNEFKIKQDQNPDLAFINSQSASSDDRIASLAYYLIGLNNFKEKNYEDSALNLMRVIYLFPEYTQLNYKASYYLILAQHYLNHIDKAMQNFDQYNSYLPDWQTNYLREKLFK